MNLAEILAATRPTDNGLIAEVPENWRQGRTAYGGLSSALALHAAQQLAPDLPPLRSAQVAFIGPLAGEVRVVASQLRRGRNAAFIQSDVIGENGLGLRANFVFMRALESRVDHDTTPLAPFSPPAEGAETYAGPRTFFTSNFEFIDPMPEASPTEWTRWARLRERDGLDPAIELLAIGDALPPAAFDLFNRQAPISSLNWQINLRNPVPSTDKGWWLLRSTTEAAQGGFSSQAMSVWNAAGERVADAMQAVAIFA